MHVAAAAGRDVVDVRQRETRVEGSLCGLLESWRASCEHVMLREPHSRSCLIGKTCPWLCGGTTSLAEDPTIQVSTPPCQVGVFVTLCRTSDITCASLLVWEACSRSAVERLKGPLCRITEARPSPEAASGTLCLVEC
jgi:hypothetical protein